MNGRTSWKAPANSAWVQTCEHTVTRPAHAAAPLPVVFTNECLEIPCDPLRLGRVCSLSINSNNVAAPYLVILHSVGSLHKASIKTEGRKLWLVRITHPKPSLQKVQHSSHSSLLARSFPCAAKLASLIRFGKRKLPIVMVPNFHYPYHCTKCWKSKDRDQCDA